MRKSNHLMDVVIASGLELIHRQKLACIRTLVGPDAADLQVPTSSASYRLQIGLASASSIAYLCLQRLKVFSKAYEVASCLASHLQIAAKRPSSQCHHSIVETAVAVPRLGLAQPLGRISQCPFQQEGAQVEVLCNRVPL